MTKPTTKIPRCPERVAWATIQAHLDLCPKCERRIPGTDGVFCDVYIALRNVWAPKWRPRHTTILSVSK